MASVNGGGRMGAEKASRSSDRIGWKATTIM